MFSLLILLPGNHTYMDTEFYWSMGSASRGASNSEATQVMNPIACLHLDDILLFTVTRHHYPQYDVWVRKLCLPHLDDWLNLRVCLVVYSENLFNTNAAFDWGVFRLLEQELAMAQSANSLFSVSFSEPGVYVIKLSSNQHKHVVLSAFNLPLTASKILPCSP